MATMSPTGLFPSFEAMAANARLIEGLMFDLGNEPDEYLAYIERIGKGTLKTEDEKEEMIFNSAEQIFLSDNYERALVSLKSYIDRYPDGRHTYKADFYMAESYKNLGKLTYAKLNGGQDNAEQIEASLSRIAELRRAEKEIERDI